MNYNKSKLTRQLKKHEGLRLESYRDSVGVLTIGYGRNLNHLTISQYQANRWLSQDINSAVADLLAKKGDIVEKLNPARQRVLINMTFNLGIEGLLRFKKMWKALESEDFEKAATEMYNSLWAIQVGRRAEELVKQMREG